MAVVDARQNLFHEHGSILLRKLASSHDFIEKLSTFADVSYDVVSFLIFEEFIHLKNVWVIEVLQVVNFVEEHLLFVFIHVRFSQDLHGSLCTTFSMDTDSDFPKSSRPEHFTNPIVVT